MMFREKYPEEKACGNCRHFTLKGENDWGEHGKCSSRHGQAFRYVDYNDCDMFEAAD